MPPRLLVLFLLITSPSPSALAADPVLLFEDDFNRDESTPDQEDIGNGWTSNSAWRANGNQQVDLLDGTMNVIRHPEADHGVAIFHDVAFQDGEVEMRVKLAADGDLGLDFVDREYQPVHAGHLCIAKITTKGVTLTDSKTGTMDLKIRERRQNGDKDPELLALLKTKTQSFPHPLPPDTWHTFKVRVEGDVMTAFVNGKEVGSFKSEGIAHPTKRMITLAVNTTATIDDLKVWKLK